MKILWTLKKLFGLIHREKGFVLIEFVIALPLVMMLLYGLSLSTFTIFSTAKSQAADYVLEVEAQDALTRITNDLRSASSIEIKKRFGDKDIYTLIINYHAIRYNPSVDSGRIVDIIDTRVYRVSTSFKLQAKRKDDNGNSNPMTGGNFFGDTVITSLKYSKLDEKVVRVELEMESLATGQGIKISTAVYMPACEKIEFL